MERKAEKHIPMRMCVGCRNMTAKSALIRVAAVNGELFLDDSQKIQARGIYICKNKACIELAIKKKVFSRILKKKAPDEFCEELILRADG